MQDVSEIRIRLAECYEAQEVGELVAGCFAIFREALPLHIFQPYVEEASDIEGRWGEASVAVLEAGGRIVGTVTYYENAGNEGMGWPDGYAGLRTLAVLPSYQGFGYGRALCQWCIDAARRQNADRLALHTASFMKSACALYESLGFQRSPVHDLLASNVLGFDLNLGDQRILAYMLPLRKC